MYEFCTVQASSIYLEAIKDRLYCDPPGSPRRRATQGVLHEMLLALTKLLAPILPHTCEEAWEHIPRRPADSPASVHLALMPEVDEQALAWAESVSAGWCQSMRFQTDTLSPSPVMIWNRLLDLRSAALVKLEAARNAGVKNPLDCQAVFIVAKGDGPARAFLELYLSELEDLLGVGYASIEEGDLPAGGERIGVRIQDTRQRYARCARCWKRRPDVGSDADYPDLSARDAAVVKALKNGGPHHERK
jgi:isoleucyl-tRNA synthetase